MADLTVADRRDGFDVVSAAGAPLAIRSDARPPGDGAAARPGGRVVVLDYDHTKIERVPAAVTHFCDSLRLA